MPVETRTLPGAILRERGGEELANGWTIVIYESAGKWKPLPEWRGEMIVADEEQRQAQRAAAMGNLRVDNRPIGSNVEHGGPLDAWTKLAHALLQTNEAVFVN